MSEKWNVELHMSPGGWTAGVSEAAEARQNASAAAEQAGTAASLFTVTGT
ncbi:MAG: hypothetical protein JSY10_10115, partial [Paenibacillus sp.]|nr:hypothetical protein [Paenibacillus sp.]